MTLTEIIALRDDHLLYDLDDSSGSGSTPTTTQKLVSVNEAIRDIAIQIQQFHPKIALTLTAGTDLYNIRSLSVVDKRVVRPYYVVINGYALYDCAQRNSGLWSMDELEREVPNWRAAASGTPTKAVQVSNGRMLLNPPPTQAVVDAGQNYIAGTYIPPNYTSSDVASEPDLPEELHPAVARLSAVRAALPFVTEAEGWKRLEAYQSEWGAAVEDVRRSNFKLLQSFGSTSGWGYSDVIRL